ncbi:MAG TPA: flagellar hook-associated protein FlgK [Firmicutes bacterium]|jgi:flagellar hook-associated protein 1 FlgK|nr:flagellar hook-associated protein FlgK [Bacillota bacterium]
MSSTFGSFEIGRRALHAQQKGSEVTGQNIANANTEGYSRQSVLMKALVPPAAPGVNTPPGYGVAISDITRMKSEFYSDQIMKSLTARHYWERLKETYDTVEVIFQEPGDRGINVLLNEFFDAWQEVSTNPESYAARISLREQADSLVGVVQDIYKRLDELKYDVLKELEANVNQVNALADQIADLNQKIVYLQSIGQKSNEMLDERDLRLQELSKLLNIRAVEKANGSVEVLAGGHILLHGEHVFPLEIKEKIGAEGEDNRISIVNGLGTEISVLAGEIAGVLDSYNDVIPKYQDGLDKLVFKLVEKVNDLHRGGYGLVGSNEVNFFVKIDDVKGAVTHFEVNPDILNSNEGLNFIAAASADESPGNGENALALAKLRERLVMNEAGEEAGEDKGTATFHDFYRGLIADLGVEGREAERMFLSTSAVAENMMRQQEAVSGVSLDDEMLNLVQYQHAYNAAARFMNTLDQMLSVLFSEIGG